MLTYPPVKKVSVVIPVYNEQDSLPELLRRTDAACATLGRQYEILLIDDGSSDDSARMLTEAAEAEGSHVVAVLLNRNYGQHSAIMAGFSHVTGDLIITLDADLQNPPEEIPRLVAKADEGYDVVGTVRQNRQDSIFRKTASKMINRLIQRTTGKAMGDYGCMLRAYRRHIIDAMLNCHERSTFIPILANTFARRAVEIPVMHAEREFGDSKYSFMRLINLMYDLVTCLTTTPLRLLSIFGSVIALLGFAFGLLLVVLRLAFGPQWAAEGVFMLFAVLFMFIVAQQAVAIGADDAALTLHRKLCAAATELLSRALPAILAGTTDERPQDHSQATYVGRRTPEDGRLDWELPAQTLHNLVRAVSDPWPGAFGYAGANKFIVWKSRVRHDLPAAKPGTVLSIAPLIVACQDGALEIVTGQTERGVYMQGAQLAQALGLVSGAVISSKPVVAIKRRTRVLILGVNGFIGNHLTERLLQDDNYEIYGLDIGSDAISRFLDCPRFHFVEGDISIHSEWIEYHIKKCDVVLPLVAIATPIEYTRNPLRVFELDFEENLKIIRDCVKYNKRIIFPSTSEVYGMCTDKNFDEDSSNLVVGPINKQRWIYSVSKQLLDRVIWAYGDKNGLKFTLFRPFNWMGPRLDNLNAARIGSSRAITQLILNLVEGSPIKLIEGGKQKRCFTDISDGIEALFRIIENKDGRCDGQIINIGNPDNEASIKELAEMLLACFERHPLRDRFPPFAGFREVESSDYYGKGYQDVEHRKPSIRNAKRCLNWEPKVEMEETVEHTLDFFLRTVELVDDKNP